LPLQPALGICGATLLVASFALTVLEVQPFVTYTYELSWWSLIAVLDGVVWWRRGRSPIASRPLGFAVLALWSVAFWFLFEALNLRLQNWYYVNVHLTPLWTLATSFVSYSTVLPGVWLAAEAIGAILPPRPAQASERPRRLPRWSISCVPVLGVASLALPMVWPALFYPLVWGAVFFLLEPVNYRLGAPSLLRQWERGEYRTTLVWLGAGLACGLFWELLNFWSRVKWIYTVPFVEGLKLFEMPLAGFLGFPPFALECWVFVQALERIGLGPGLNPQLPQRRRALRLALSGLAATVLCAVVLPAMAKRTIASTYPGPDQVARDLDELGPADSYKEADGLDAFELREKLREDAGDPMIRVLSSRLEIATLAGIGLEKARALQRTGVPDVSALAAAEPAAVFERLRRELPEARLTPAEVRVWVRAAERRTGAGQ
jgi:hypothetical protein